MNYKETAELTLKGIGGKENLISAAHCATRLRLVLADESKVDKTAVEDVDGVKGVFTAQGQVQIIFGTGVVNKVYDEFVKVSGVDAASKEDVKQAAAAKTNKFKQLIKTLGDVFVPIIPAIVAGGVIMGILSAVEFIAGEEGTAALQSNAFYMILKLMSNAAFTFLPILIGFSAVKTFGGNPFLGAVLGMFMIHPDLQNAWNVASEGVNAYANIGPYAIPLVGYQGHVIPVVVGAFVLSKVEIKLHKIVPDMIDLFVTPLLSLLVSCGLTFIVIGPLFSAIENAVLTGVQWLLTLPYGIGGFLIGWIYAPTVVGGIHHMYTLIDLGQLSQYGLTFWLPIASAANMAQAGACLAVAVKSKNGKIKSLAYPSALSAALGITEPAIFGVNLRFAKPFIGGLIGAAFGAAYASFVHLGAAGTGVTGIFGILLHLHSPIHYIITITIATAVAFIATWIIGWKDN